MVFPEGIVIDIKKRTYRTSKINSRFLVNILFNHLKNGNEKWGFEIFVCRGLVEKPTNFDHPAPVWENLGLTQNTMTSICSTRIGPMWSSC